MHICMTDGLSKAALHAISRTPARSRSKTKYEIVPKRAATAETCQIPIESFSFNLKAKAALIPHDAAIIRKRKTK